MTTAPPRAGTPIARPAPMAPRAPAGGPPAMDFGERIRQQREAAERMAEQRVAEAKERAAHERTAASPSFLSTGQQNAQKPRFTFADEELKQAQQDTVAQAAVGGRQARPIFTAERPQRPVEAPQRQASAAPRPTGPSPAPYQPRPTTAPMANRPQASLNPPHHQRPNEHQWQRPAQAPPPRDGIRRELPPTGQAPDRAYGDAQAFRGQPRRPEARDRNDYRGAHARELAYVEEESEDLFEDDRAAAPRRRAAAQDYAQAYQEYDGADEAEEPRRRLGPFLLLGALLVVAAIAAGLIYVYQRSGGLEASTGAVPVVSVPEQPVKTVPETGQVTDETLAPESEGEELATPDASTQTPAQKKQIYDRILGDTTQDETNQLAPGEEQPIVPNPTGDTEVEPIPLPLPPQPGGSDGQSGALEQPAPQVTAGVAQPATAPAETSSVASVESVTESESSDPTATPTAASTSTAVPETDGVTQVSESAALNVTSEPPPVVEAPEPPEPEIAAETASTTTPAPAPPAQEIAAAETATGNGAGPISITPG
ncbi:MAG TPA: hypothetical protein VJS40_09885, partial [Aestuariivirgaceae bacterium]|nr:hypothetical protein [Aestuariivirgaceae bacterium]